MINTRLLLLAAIAPALALSACKKSGDGTVAGNTAAPAASGPIAAAPSGGWTETVALTPDNGFRMGNPQAPVKLVEYGSLTCPHCADFSAEAMPTLRKWIDGGKLSYEYRNFVRDPYDITAALLARCGGAGPFFKLTDQLYASQKDWIGKIEALTEADRKRIQALPTAQQFGALAAAAGLDTFVGQRGIPAAKAQQCLTDEAQQKVLIDIRQAGVTKYTIEGTPTFILNGETIGSADWAGLQPKLTAAIGG